MFMVLVRGKIINIEKRSDQKGEKATAIVTLSLRVYRQGQSVNTEVLVTLDAYQTERFSKLNSDTKYITFRCSDAIPMHETNKKGDVEDLLWLKGEEFYL